MRKMILSVVLTVAFGPAVQATGLGVHGACHGTGHAQHQTTTEQQPAAETAHAGHHADHGQGIGADQTAVDPAIAMSDSKCECGCLCPPGHACSSTSAGITTTTAALSIAPEHFSPQVEAFGVADAQPTPRNRPPIDALR